MKPIVNAVGNLTKDVVLEYTKTNNIPMVRFTIACNGSREGDAVFLWCKAYDKSAENIAKFFRKGDQIQILGELSQYSDERKESHTYCEVMRWSFAGPRRRETPPPADEPAYTPKKQSSETGDSDEPF